MVAYRWGPQTGGHRLRGCWLGSRWEAGVRVQVGGRRWMTTGGRLDETLPMYYKL